MISLNVNKPLKQDFCKDIDPETFIIRKIAKKLAKLEGTENTKNMVKREEIMLKAYKN